MAGAGARGYPALQVVPQLTPIRRVLQVLFVLAELVQLPTASQVVTAQRPVGHRPVQDWKSDGGGGIS